MPVFISPFDQRFVKLGAAARLTADEHPTLAQEDVMDMLARAIFSGAFDPDPVDDTYEATTDKQDSIEDWIHIPIEAPINRLSPAQQKLKPKPVEYFGANRKTIASVMHSVSGLPGDCDQWEQLLDAAKHPNGEIDAFTALIRTPFETFPATGRRFLEGAYIPKTKLKRWLELRDIPLPSFLNAEQLAPHRPRRARGRSRITAARAKRTQGRPPKTSWTTIISTMLKLREENPNMQKKALAFEARRVAAETISEKDLPSVGTIQRKIGEILRNQHPN